jgi:hypothetical protein
MVRGGRRGEEGRGEEGRGGERRGGERKGDEGRGGERRMEGRNKWQIIPPACRESREGKEEGNKEGGRKKEGKEIMGIDLKAGWYYTGDVAMEIAPRRIKLIDRKKNIFKLSHVRYPGSLFLLPAPFLVPPSPSSLPLPLSFFSVPSPFPFPSLLPIPLLPLSSLFPFLFLFSLHLSHLSRENLWCPQKLNFY